MNRVWNYAGFVVWFLWLGYIVLWLAGSPEHWLLPPALHLAGLASATFVAVRLLLLSIARWRAPVSVVRADRCAQVAAAKTAAPAA